MTDEDIKCPFCGEEDFDKVGLKYHLERYCQEYKDTPGIDEWKREEAKGG